MSGQWFRIVADDSGHDYVIPSDKAEEWDAFLSGDVDTWDVPEWAIRIDGGPLVFQVWRIGE